MKLRVGLNGFGRIGRAIYRISRLTGAFSVVAINDLNPDNLNMAYLLKNDSTYGRYPGSVEARDTGIIVDGEHVPCFHQRSPRDVPWDDLGVATVVDSIGDAANLASWKQLDDGVKNVVVTNAPDDPDVQPIIFGCNEDDLRAATGRLFSASICDAVALAPIVRLLQDSLGIEHGNLLTLHPWLANGNVLDAPYTRWNERGEKLSNFVLGRAAPMNLLPKTTTAVKAATKVLPGLDDVLASFSFRVPTNIVCGAVLTLNVGRATSVEEIEDLFASFERNQRYRVLRSSDEPLISGDFTGEEYSAVIDRRWTSVLGEKLVRIAYWYDNEWGYSSRAIDLVCALNGRAAAVAA